MKAPFPYFGGKRKVAPEVWAALGDVDNYVDPFAGSLAVLLERPTWHTGTTETVNDADQYIANFWRALAYDPDAVAHHADWPVNEADLFSRHLWLVNEGKRRMIAGMEADPEWFDAKIAGWWVWGLSCWIGSGWCSGNGPHKYADGLAGVASQRPHLSHSGVGVNRKRPHLQSKKGITRQQPTPTFDPGVRRQIPHLGNGGQGVNRKRPHLVGSRGGGTGVHDKGRGNLHDYMQALANRLRDVRVCCGDWGRIVTPGALTYGATVGVFLDPPYSAEAGRDNTLYAVESLDVAHEVRDWCIANGDNPRYHIVLAGYEAEHGALMPPTWRKYSYSAGKAYATSQSDDSPNASNRHEERLWFSPFCLQPQPTLFALDTQPAEPHAAGGLR